MRAEELQAIRTDLNRRRRTVLETARRTDAELDALRESGGGAEMEEEARARSDEDQLARLADAERGELARIDAALARMDRGAFGRCAECGEEIGARRLRALPHALRCQDCEEDRERATAR